MLEWRALSTGSEFWTGEQLMPLCEVNNGVGLDTLWDANDVAHYLKASRSWVYQKAEAGVIPSVRIFGLLRFHPGAIRAFAREPIANGRLLPLTRRGH